MNYVGIDLGTTNSAICSYDGENVRLYKSPEQADVTPSAIFVDRRGNKYVGANAYNNAARSPENAAILFKRLMGTNTPIQLLAVKRTMTPEECSAEILRVLFGYLPEQMRTGETGTVITVPAAFNQMQKDATMAAADAANIGRVALMQEPVAAVMSVLRSRKSDGIFLVYDLGGGTLDIAVAQNIDGRVSLMGHSGIAMCGGRDFDKSIFQSLVRPWLLENFDLPEDFDRAPQFKPLTHMAMWASERAKIELSQRPDAVISISETELRARDNSDAEVYLEIPLNRAQLDTFIEERVRDSVTAASETLAKAGLSPQDVERMVFIGGPTQYKPLRDRVATALGIAASTDVNPMTAVAEGAAVFAESIDWNSKRRSRKSARGVIAATSQFGLTLNFTARTPDSKARIVPKMSTAMLGAEIQFDSLDTGWSSGRVALKEGSSVDVPLAKPGDNTFKIFVFDQRGGPIALPQDKIVIVRTAATIDAIPASHSIAVEVQEKVGGRTKPDFLVREGEQLPKTGRKIYKAAESLKAGSTASLNFRLWEGEIQDHVTENRFIGVFKIKGSDFDSGVIHAGAELVCDYEIQDSGQIKLDVTVKSVGGTFASGHNFYSRQEGQIDYTKASQLLKQQSTQASERLQEMSAKVEDPRIDLARQRLERATSASTSDNDPETAKQALDDIQEVRRLLAQTRRAHLADIRQLELSGVVTWFDSHVRQYARPTEAAAFDNLARTAQRSISNSSGDFEEHLDALREKNFAIMFRQDWFVIDRFKGLAESAFLFPNAETHAALVGHGTEALRASDMDRLRQVVIELYSARWAPVSDEAFLADSNIMLG